MDQKYIINKYPALFSRYHLPMSQTCMCWGLQIGKGWLPIIDDLCAKIQKLIDEKHIENFEFECIKEKYGSLRIQAYTHHNLTQQLIRKAVNSASDTCENCSKHIEYFSSDDSDEIEEYTNNDYDRLCDDCK